MNHIVNILSKQLLGAKYERLTRSLLICLILFLGLNTADLGVQVAPSVFYLTVTVFTAGIMWQALSSETYISHMQHLLMLPFDERSLVLSCTAALGIYTFFTKTAVLLAVLLALSNWSPIEIIGSIFCVGNAVFMTAAVFSLRKYWYAGLLWSAALFAVLFCFWNRLWFLPVLIVNSMLSFFFLRYTDGYSFCQSRRKNKWTIKRYQHGSIGRYFFRYLTAHKNYLANTAVMWGMACVLPLFFKQMEDLSFLPMGFALLSLNTPVCILLSCDPALEQAVRFLPGQKKRFCVPYCLYLFLCNLTADVIFLVSLQFQIGGVPLQMMATAVFFALQSAVCSVLLEWFYPIRGWKIESDLWHHPRKYLVPAAMFLLAGAVGMMPAILPVLLVLLTIEIIGLLICCHIY